MAAGDKAAAAGLPVVAPTADRRQGYEDINKVADALADHMTSPAAHGVASITGLSAALAAKANAADVYGRGVIDAAFASQNGIDAPQNARLSALEAAPAPTSAADTVTSGAYGRTVSGGGYYAMWMDAGLRIGRNTSSRRYKEEIEPVALDPADVLALQPVTYHRKGSPNGAYEFGLIAEDVNEHVPEIVVEYGGEIDGVRYDLLAVALLAVVKDQAAQLTDLTARIDALEETA